VTIDQAQTADDLLTALADVPVDRRCMALQGRQGAAWLRMLRAAADLQGASYADTMTRRQAVDAILENF
jgi:hypothetical protein